MHRYLPGILLVQIVTVVLGWASLNFAGEGALWLWLLPAALLAVVTALWFASIERARGRAAIDNLRLAHAREREKLKVAVEKDKARTHRDAAKDMKREERRMSRKANLKVGLAFGATAIAGVLLLITEMLTLGFMTITTAAGAMGGYLLRWRQAGAAQPDVKADEARYCIEAEEVSEGAASTPARLPCSGGTPRA